MSTKHEEYFKRMLKLNKELFDKFKKLHDEYALNPRILQEKFNQEGEKVLIIIRDWENKLCLQSEKAGYANYTTSLAEKFQSEVRKHFPEIVNVGLKTQMGKLKTSNPSDFFEIKKINLH